MPVSLSFLSSSGDVRLCVSFNPGEGLTGNIWQETQRGLTRIQTKTRPKGTILRESSGSLTLRDRIIQLVHLILSFLKSTSAAIRPKLGEWSSSSERFSAFHNSENCSSTQQPKEKRHLQTLPAYITHCCDSAVYFCIFQVFISSEFLSHLNPAPRWGELELLTRISGRTLKCISPSSVETVWIRLISSLTKLPRRESSLSAR